MSYLNLIFNIKKPKLNKKNEEPQEDKKPKKPEKPKKDKKLKILEKIKLKASENFMKKNNKDLKID